MFTDIEIQEAGGKTKQDIINDWTYDVSSGHTTKGLAEWIEFNYPVVDRFGNRWPEDYDLCPECKQPDNCGDCNHEPLTSDQVRWIGGVPGDG